MKIEKLNDNQIRCTLTKEDLVSRQLKISELAYGTEKAKRLFHEMMQQANFEFGFEAEDIPLMIEAIPMNAECVVLVITKVEDPEELDTRFARFSPSEQDEEDDEEELLGNTADEMFDMLRSLQKAPDNAQAPTQTPAAPATRVFRFTSLGEVMNAAARIGNNCSYPNALYKDEVGGGYLLTISQEEASRQQYDRLCNILSEYGALQRGSATTYSYFEEHYEALIPENALQHLIGKA